MRLPVTLAALAVATVLALPSSAQAGGLREMERSWSHICDWFDGLFRRETPNKEDVNAKPAKAKAAKKK
jgi:hypothetical protein